MEDLGVPRELFKSIILLVDAKKIIGAGGPIVKGGRLNFSPSICYSLDFSLNSFGCLTIPSFFIVGPLH